MVEEALSWPSIVAYIVSGFFAACQRRHARLFRGDSEEFRLVLSVSAFATILTGFAYLVYYGWAVVWWAAIAIFVIGFVASGVYTVVLKKLVSVRAFSLAGFMGWPVCAYFMFYYVPVAT